MILEKDTGSYIIKDNHITKLEGSKKNELITCCYSINILEICY